MEFSRITMKITLVIAFAVLILQLISADVTARGVAKNQPPKLAAMEGIYQTQGDAALTLLGWVDEESQTVKGIKLPGFLSYLIYHDTKGVVQGLDQVPKEDWPHVQTVFQTYHLMIWMWGLMFLVAVFGLILMKKGKLEKSKWLLRCMVASVLFPQVANQVGWMTAEIGRQPWVVWGLLRTVHGVSKSIVANQVFTSIIMFIVIYLLLLFLFLYLLDQKIKQGPEEVARGRKEKAPVYRNPFEA